MNSKSVPPKTRHVEERCTLNLSRAQTSSRWCGEARPHVRGSERMENHGNWCVPSIAGCEENAIWRIYSPQGVGEEKRGITTINPRIDSTAILPQGTREESIVVMALSTSFH
ncbi:hypothetical protein TNCV_36961 [Trichonephila clavipes]|nr:hypothetical protein TNCV_36961 [Trichonephila clavipes]